MTQEEIRRQILKALYSDQWLYSRLVLKGGNALSIVYGVGGRSSLDLDFSMRGDFEDIEFVSSKVQIALEQSFRETGILVFDYFLVPKPRKSRNPRWGGYRAEFKLIPVDLVDRLGSSIEAMRRQALAVGPGSDRRKYTIDISKYEYVDDQVDRTLDDFVVRVYSPVLLAVEKLRALLQQHPDYREIPQGLKRSRARDVYDICVLEEHFAIRLEAHLETVRAVFEAKGVDPILLVKLSELRDLHEATWADVELSVPYEIEEFVVYFARVVEAGQLLYAEWIENAP